VRTGNGKPIYLDYNATTPIDPDVRDAMLPYQGEHFGNPSSNYTYGERARTQVAALIGTAPEGIVFTSGGSESDNHAIIGAELANIDKRKHIITSHLAPRTSRIEHPAVLNTCRYLEDRLGFKVSYLSVDKYGLVNPDDVRNAAKRNTILISIIHDNDHFL
jgi:cysteine desulfurase